MTTKAPSAVQPAPETAIEKIAYASVSTIPTVEPNDQNRLGYHVWRWLQSKQGTLEQAVAESGSRMKISQQEAVKIISESLQKLGAAPK